MVEIVSGRADILLHFNLQERMLSWHDPSFNDVLKIFFNQDEAKGSENLQWVPCYKTLPLITSSVNSAIVYFMDATQEDFKKMCNGSIVRDSNPVYDSKWWRFSTNDAKSFRLGKFDY